MFSKFSCMSSVDVLSEFKNTTMLSKIANLANMPSLKSLAKSYGISIMNVAWEDCARGKDSCFGPSISDLTLNVNGTNMPLMRKPNYADISSDQDITKFNLIVGNETNSEKTMITLKNYLERIDKYTGNSKLKSMYLERDEKILTSAQACILPLIDGEVSFNIKLYNYQSFNEPAVLIIVCSSEGTSTQIVKGQNCTLYFNKAGKNANYIAERLSDDRKRRGVSLEGAMTNEEKQRNALLIFQIPLIYKENTRKLETSSYPPCEYIGCLERGERIHDDILSSDRGTIRSRGLENAVIKTSDAFGKFIGTEDRELIRDGRFPIRCTIQYYKVTDTVDISETMIKEIAQQINKQYESVTDEKRGSLVFGKSERKTEAVLSSPYKFDEDKTMMDTL